MTAIAPQTAPRQRMEPPIRSKAHRQWVASKNCLACGRNGETAHHILRDPTRCGMKRKSCDSAVIPLCNKCHRILHDAYGDEEAFFKDHSQANYREYAAELWHSSPARKDRT